MAQREHFAPDELAVVLSHYDVGIIESAREFARGSRQSPKLLLSAPTGRYLLKRRAVGRDRPERVEFTHALLRHLHERGFSVPRLVTTRDGQTLVTHQNRVYEVFEFLDGQRYSESLGETTHAGRTLARFHHHAAELDTGWQPVASSFHDLSSVKSGLNSIPTTVASHDSVVGHEAELLSTTQELYERYEDAAAKAGELGFLEWRQTINHGDWHPGNMLFSHDKVCVVLDFDAVRPAPRVCDIANGLLQFSILRSAGDPIDWPDFFDLTRMRRFFRGYLTRLPLSPAQREALPHLIIESAIAECVHPIAATGSLGQLQGYGVLMMLKRKVRWLADKLPEMLRWMLD